MFSILENWDLLKQNSTLGSSSNSICKNKPILQLDFNGNSKKKKSETSNLNTLELNPTLIQTSLGICKLDHIIIMY
jgi:hypothetical protein